MTTARRPAEVETTVEPTDLPPPRRPSRLRPLLRGRADDPGWVRPGLLVLLFGTAVMYLWNLGAAGNANGYYAAAVQAGTKSWKAFLFGSFDAANFITVDKPPASLWVMELSGRIFGFSSWSMLVPQVLEGVAAVALLYAAVRRWHGPAAGLLAGAALALTPVAALMFRYNNPDALLTLLLVASAYATVRAVEAASTRWLLVAGTLTGFAFLTKMLQGFLVIPALALVYLVAAPTSLQRRIGQLVAAGAAVIVSAGWWVALVELWPASSRPYIGGSTTNSVLQLAFGYNGLSRIFGGTSSGGGTGGGSGGAPGGGGFGGAAGLTRLFNTQWGGEISWLLPAALIALIAGVCLAGRAGRTNRIRASLLLWGGWLLVNGLVFSYMQGLAHPYYAVAIAPPIAALIAVAGREAWRRRGSWLARIVLAGMVAASSAWSYVLLNRVPTWHPEVRYTLVGLCALAVTGLLAGGLAIKQVAVAGLAAAVLAGAAGSAAYAVGTVATPRTGPDPSSGPAQTTSMLSGSIPSGGTGDTASQGGAAANAELTSLLAATTTTWAAATVGVSSGASLELSSNRNIMAIGGFTGTDATPTLAQFKNDIAQGKIRYFISGSGSRSGMGRSRANSVADAISSWVSGHYTPTTVSGQTVYDLAKPTSS